MSFLINPYAFLAAGGDFESIATVTVGSGGASSIEFTSIPGTYQHLQIRGIGKDARTGFAASQFTVRFNSDSASNYAYHSLYADGSSALAFGAANGTGGAINIAGSGTPFHAAVVDILDYADTNKFKTSRAFSAGDNNGSGQVNMSSWLWRSTSAITSIQLIPLVANIAQHSTYALYGVRA